MLRGFTDVGGTEWRVWPVLPSPLDAQQDAVESLRMSLSGTPYANGWLCFESATEKRRLAPIPEGWEFLDAPVLQQLCDAAQQVPARRRRDVTVATADAAGAA
jgi:hypothetical protein